MKKNIKPNVFCVVCSTERERPRLRTRNKLLILMESFLVGFVVSAISYFYLPSFTFWAGVLSAVLSFLAFEVYDNFQFKKELICPVCGFDPVLFKEAPEKAKDFCQKTIEKKYKTLWSKWDGLQKNLEKAHESMDR